MCEMWVCVKSLVDITCVCVCRHACVSKYVILLRSDHTSQLVHLSSNYDYILLQNLAKNVPGGMKK
jgi:hypothetical protein